MKLKFLSFLLYLTLWATSCVDAQYPAVTASTVGVNQGSGYVTFAAADLDLFNRWVDIGFLDPVYHSTGGPVVASDFQITFTANGGSATDVDIASITQEDGGSLVGGELFIRVNLTLTGDASGVETIEIKPSAFASIISSAGKVISSGESTGLLRLYVTYNSYYEDVLNYAISNNIPIPDADWREIDSEAFDLLESDGFFTYAKSAFMLWAQNKYFGMINICDPGVGNATENGLPTWTPQSGVRSGGGGAINSNFIPSVSFTAADNACVVVYVDNNANANGLVLVSGYGTGSNVGRVQLGGRRNDNTLRVALNRTGTGVATPATLTNSMGVYQLDTDATDLKLYKDGSLNYTGVKGSALSDRQIAICAENQDGTFNLFNTYHDIGFVSFGNSMRSLSTSISGRILTWISNLKTVVLPDVPPEPGVGGVNRLYMLTGQSNMDGRGQWATASTYLKGELANCYIWRTNKWEVLEAGVNANNLQPVTYAGAILSLAYEERAKHPNDILYFINESKGGTTLENEWEPVTGSRYIALKDTYDAVMSLGTTFTEEAIIWYQGEGSGTSSTATYQALEVDLFDQFDIDFGFSKYVAVNIWLSGANVSNIRAAKQNNATNGLYTLVDTQSINTTMLDHLNMSMLEQLGIDLSAAL